jgi:hypothetical protein
VPGENVTSWGMGRTTMRRSTRLHLIAVSIAALGFGLFAVPLWIVTDAPWSEPLALAGLGLLFVGVLSGLGFGPLGRARDRAAVVEDAAYRQSMGQGAGVTLPSNGSANRER